MTAKSANNLESRLAVLEKKMEGQAQWAKIVDQSTASMVILSGKVCVCARAWVCSLYTCTRVACVVLMCEYRGDTYCFEIVFRPRSSILFASGNKDAT